MLTVAPGRFRGEPLDDIVVDRPQMPDRHALCEARSGRRRELERDHRERRAAEPDHRDEAQTMLREPCRDRAVGDAHVTRPLSLAQTGMLHAPEAWPLREEQDVDARAVDLAR